MKRMMLILCLLMVVLAPAVAQNNELQNSVKDISAELALINQQIVNAYQAQQNETQLASNKVQVQQSSSGFVLKIPIVFQSGVVASMDQTGQEKRPPKGIPKEQTQDVYEIIINKMRALKMKYENNPYIRIVGFDINIGIPPSVTISIEFKS
ncbi:MAG TPA: hypothetical protein VHZ76_07560 [Gammaproteobacteria bacterium]|jgi:hypothetical protein|nr:hypothetical protein [Gammaproteobacteria bacterium]